MCSFNLVWRMGLFILHSIKFKLTITISLPSGFESFLEDTLIPISLKLGAVAGAWSRRLKKHPVDGRVPQNAFARMHLPILSYENGLFLLILYCKHNSSTGCCLRTSTSSSTAHRQNSQANTQFDTPIQLAGDPPSFISVSKIVHTVP